LTGFSNLQYTIDAAAPQKTRGKTNVVAASVEIRDVTRQPLEQNAILVQRSYQTVADAMGITPENAPRYTAFITAERLGEERDAGSVSYGLFMDGTQAGFVTVQQDEEQRWHMRRLAVLPEYRNRGLGRLLIDRVVEHVREQGAKVLHIGIINEQAGLKEWYEGMGFREYRTFSVDHLPFTVGLLAVKLEDYRAEV
jgi:ribosomal protein S18 acetylase RimI-like enzyme